MILMIDNYDSFTYNIVDCFVRLGQKVAVFRNDKIAVKDIKALRPERLIIGPGPGSPKDAGVSVAAIKAMAGVAPILGVSLGHQAIAVAFGGKTARADRPMHGLASEIYHDNDGLFKGLPNPFRGCRYNSLMVAKASLPASLEITAWSKGDDEIMGLRHKSLAVHGVQFHPEAFLSERGLELFANFLAIEKAVERASA